MKLALFAARHDHVHMRFAPETSKEQEHRGSRGKAMGAQVTLLCKGINAVC